MTRIPWTVMYPCIVAVNQAFIAPPPPKKKKNIGYVFMPKLDKVGQSKKWRMILHVLIKWCVDGIGAFWLLNTTLFVQTLARFLIEYTGIFRVPAFSPTNSDTIKLIWGGWVAKVSPQNLNSHIFLFHNSLSRPVDSKGSWMSYIVLFCVCHSRQPQL